MMLRQEWPELLEGEDRERAQRLSESVMDVGEFLWSLRKEERFNTDFKSSPGVEVAYHAPCHLRAQRVGFKGRDLLRKIPGVKPKTVMECCGHDGTYAYTRDGAFKIDSNGQLVNSNGLRLMPEVILPEDFIRETLAVSQDGRVSVKVPGLDDPVEVGQLELYRFVNPAGLRAVGENLYILTNASGDPIAGRPGFDGMGQINQRFIEMSNVSTVQEMVDMIVAQRAYEFNSKAIQTSDNMLGTAVNLKR